MGVSSARPQHRVSGGPRSMLSSELRQHLCFWVRAEEGHSHPTSPVKPPSAGPLPLAQTVFPAATTNDALFAAAAAAAPGVWPGG